MNEIYNNLFVGSLEEYEQVQLDNTSYVLHAAKEPYHRQFVGYTGRACDKDHPEYLKAIRGREVAANIVDAKESRYFDYDLIFSLVKDILTLLIEADRKVYIHCNLGESRAPSIGLLVLLGLHAVDTDYETAQRQFLSIYPNYNPGQGMKDFVRENWDRFVKASTAASEVKDIEVALPELTAEEEGYVRLPDDAHLHVNQ